MQRAELEIEQQDFGCGLGSHDVTSLLEPVDRRITAHKADHRALYRGIETEVVEDVEVESRRIQPCAARHQNVRDAAAFRFAELELVEGLLREQRRKALKDLHARGRAGEISAHVKLMRVDDKGRTGRVWGHHGKPPPDSAALCHALKDRLHAWIFEHVAGEVHERLMHIGVGDCGGDAVQVGLRHGFSKVVLGCTGPENMGSGRVEFRAGIVRLVEPLSRTLPVRRHVPGPSPRILLA